MPIGEYLSDKMLAVYGFAGSLLSSIFLSPPRYVWGISGLIIVSASFGLFLKNRWVESQPNQWLLVIRGGRLLKAGVGLKTFVSLTDSYVKFPSKVEQVSFNANNVTKQMQGVIITGFAFWSVFREGQGPFRCYKYMQGGDANHNVQAMCESALRNLIANSTLEQVMKNRNHLRDNMKRDLADQFKGWGIWLETVEITEVRISSDRLFKDLQAEFRQDTQLKAQQIQLVSQQKINESRQSSELRMAETNQLNQTKKLVTRNNEKIKRENEQAAYDAKKNELQLQRVQREAQFQIQKLKADLRQDQERLNNQQTISRARQQFQLQYLRQKIEMDKLYDEKALQKYQIDSTERIYNKLGIKQIRINQFVGEGKSNLASLLPQMGFTMGQLRPAAEQ